MAEQDTNIKSTDIFPLEGHQVPDLNKYYEFDQY